MAADDLPAFGDLLRHARRAAGLTQEELAEKAGLSVRGISDLERGVNRSPHRDTLELLADALELSVEERKQWERARRRTAHTRSRPTTVSAGARSMTRETTLPTPLTPFVGRKREQTEVGELIRRPDVRLVTLTGPGGVGKTRLAIAVAAALREVFRDGVCFVDLAPVSDADLVVATIATSMGIRPLGNRSPLDALVAACREQHLLLVIDNFEQVADASPVISTLLGASPLVMVLATSRVPLRLSYEYTYPVPPLELPDARDPDALECLTHYQSVRLFLERAQAALPGFAVTNDTAPAVAEICVRLDGLPLAIELAAARIRSLPPKAMLQRLERRLAVLTGGARDLPVRHQTLSHTIQWSYDLLSPDEQRLFRSFSVFRGGWTLEAAEAVVGDDLAIDVLDGLERLIEHSLVRVIEQPDGTPRYTMLETIREFGLVQLDAAEEAGDVQRRHSTFYLTWAEQHGWELYRGSVPRTMERIEPEIENIRAALSWVLSHDEPEARLLDAALLAGGLLWSFWRNLGRTGEGRRWLEIALTKPGASDEARGWGLDGAGYLASEQQEFARARELHEESLAIARDRGDDQRRGLALWGLGRAALWQGDLERAAVAFEQAVGITRGLDRKDFLIGTLQNLGWALVLSGDLDRGVRLLEEAIEIDWEMTGDRDPISLMDLGHAVMLQGDLERAEELLSASASIQRQLGPSRHAAQCLEKVAYLAVRQEDPRHAACLLGAADALRQTIATPMTPVHRPEYDRVTGLVRQRLGEADWEAAWSAGQAMALDEAFACAMDRFVANESKLATRQDHCLSNRELDVLHLLVEGKSNQEIATILCISPNTVANHVTSILNKLGVDSRTAAATWAVKHGVG